jgi:hypothetical protein
MSVPTPHPLEKNEPLKGIPYVDNELEDLSLKFGSEGLSDDEQYSNLTQRQELLVKKTFETSKQSKSFPEDHDRYLWKRYNDDKKKQIHGLRHHWIDFSEDLQQVKDKNINNGKNDVEDSDRLFDALKIMDDFFPRDHDLSPVVGFRELNRHHVNPKYQLAVTHGGARATVKQRRKKRNGKVRSKRKTRKTNRKFRRLRNM